LIKASFWNEHINEGDKAIAVGALEDTFKAAETKQIKKAKKAETIKTLLDIKRGQNLGIFMAMFKMPAAELAPKLLVLPLANGALEYETVVSLRKFCPTADEDEAYARYKGDKSLLSDIDQFLMSLIAIPDLRIKLDLLLTIHELPLQFDDLQPSIDAASDAVVELMSSKRLEQVLLYGLSIGNHINGGSKKGGQHGVLLKSFPKMADTRGADKTTTLMDFLYDELRRRRRTDGDLAKFTDDLKEASQAGETSIKALSAEVDMLAKDLLTIDAKAKALRAKLEATGGAGVTPESARFFSGLDRFVNRFEDDLLALGMKTEQAAEVYAEVLVKFGERPGMDSEEVFGYVVGFVARFKQAGDKHKEKKPARPSKAPTGPIKFRLPPVAAPRN